MRTVLTTIGLLLALTLFGTVGFRIFIGSDWVDCLYLAVITLTTVGSRDAGVDTASKLFVVVYLATGLGIFTFSVFQLGSWIVSADFHTML